jgi:hypothetical protein
LLIADHDLHILIELFEINKPYLGLRLIKCPIRKQMNNKKKEINLIEEIKTHIKI